ncbi:thiol-disulfide oxidoreductase DCC family protein [Algoriphagus aquatilis]|uniref:Thiol-disulfide oxidoreductase DCC family protein n=1 Tax=Algoriphagus aquatilis TaxID=490186 RepID=A0ABW0BVS5_9BACT
MKDIISIILFDGVCTLCNASIDFILKRDHKNRFLVGALQEPVSKKVLSNFQVDDSYLDSLVLVENGKVYFRSTAALRIAKKLNRPWPLFYFLIAIPAFLRDPVYNWIGKNRYRWFGKKSTCRIPTSEEKQKFLSEENLPF